MFSSIRVRLTFSHLAVIILAMGLSGVLLLSFLERYFLQATEDSLIAQARITAQALIPGAITGGPQPSPGAPGSVDARPGEASLAPAYNAVQQQQLSNLSLQAENLPRSTGALSLGEMDLTYLADASLRLSAQLETRIRILDARGVVLVDSQQEDRGKDLRADSLVARALDGGYASRTDQAGGEAAMHVSLPVLVEDRLVGVVYLSQPLRDTTAVLRDLRARWLSAMAIALLLSGVRMSMMLKKRTKLLAENLFNPGIGCRRFCKSNTTYK